MDTEWRIYFEEKFHNLHEEVHDIATDVAEIKQWKKDQDEFEEEQSSESDSKFNKVGIFIGSVAAIVATIAIII